jgi:hypothetical protein
LRQEIDGATFLSASTKWKALIIDKKLFAKGLLMFYAPDRHEFLFDDQASTS